MLFTLKLTKWWIIEWSTLTSNIIVFTRSFFKADEMMNDSETKIQYHLNTFGDHMIVLQNLGDKISYEKKFSICSTTWCQYSFRKHWNCYWIAFKINSCDLFPRRSLVFFLRDNHLTYTVWLSAFWIFHQCVKFPDGHSLKLDPSGHSLFSTLTTDKLISSPDRLDVCLVYTSRRLLKIREYWENLTIMTFRSDYQYFFYIIALLVSIQEILLVTQQQYLRTKSQCTFFLFRRHLDHSEFQKYIHIFKNKRKYKINSLA